MGPGSKKSSPQGLVVLVLPHFLPGPLQLSFPGGSVGKESACNAEDLSLIPGSGRSPGKGNDNLLWYSCPGNPMDRAAWWTTVHGVAKSRKSLSTHATADVYSEELKTYLHKMFYISVHSDVVHDKK